jgi:hypothetical protein
MEKDGDKNKLRNINFLGRREKTYGSRKEMIIPSFYVGILKQEMHTRLFGRFRKNMGQFTQGMRHW